MTDEAKDWIARTWRAGFSIFCIIFRIVQFRNIICSSRVGRGFGFSSSTARYLDRNYPWLGDVAQQLSSSMLSVWLTSLTMLDSELRILLLHSHRWNLHLSSLQFANICNKLWRKFSAWVQSLASPAGNHNNPTPSDIVMCCPLNYAKVSHQLQIYLAK